MYFLCNQDKLENFNFFEYPLSNKNVIIVRLFLSVFVFELFSILSTVARPSISLLKVYLLTKNERNDRIFLINHPKKRNNVQHYAPQ